MVEVGLEALARDPFRWVSRETRAGLLYNPASVTAGFRSARDVVACALGKRLVALFGPQHGIGADVQDNMVESGHGIDPRLNIPVWSLYSDTRKPTPAMLEGLDVLLVDLQDVGTRVFTFVWTLRLAMAACGEAGVRVIVLDRPNPLGAAVEGNRLRPEWASFVGMEPLPMRHGRTLGELAGWFRDVRGVGCEVDVVPVNGWRRGELWPDTGRPWVMPSPNMPAFDTALVFPGAVLLEGTNASEGRGTTRPFEIVGGPWVDSEELAADLNAGYLPGAAFRPVTFRPTFQKWAGRTCGGVQCHVTDPEAFRPYRTGLAVLQAFWRRYREQGFAWREPPYEYETGRAPIHLLLGNERVREGIEQGADLEELEGAWAAELLEWEEETRPCLLYS
jgi:uncharacterized protein YbbC (DUF1343 family)